MLKQKIILNKIKAKKNNGWKLHKLGKEEDIQKLKKAIVKDTVLKT